MGRELVRVVPLVVGVALLLLVLLVVLNGFVWQIELLNDVRKRDVWMKLEFEVGLERVVLLLMCLWVSVCA